MNITYTIARYDFINKDQFLVAFNIKDDFENSAYIETILEPSEISAKNTQEICQLAYDKLKSKIDALKLDFENKNISKIGFQFIPEE
jgi:hypothetical protein